MSAKSFTKCSKKDLPSCCKSTKQVYKVKDNHLFAKASLSDYNTFALVPRELFIDSRVESIVATKQLAYNSHAPPAIRVALFTLFCTYRI